MRTKRKGNDEINGQHVRRWEKRRELRVESMTNKREAEILQSERGIIRFSRSKKREISGKPVGPFFKKGPTG